MHSSSLRPRHPLEPRWYEGHHRSRCCVEQSDTRHGVGGFPILVWEEGKRDGDTRVYSIPSGVVMNGPDIQCSVTALDKRQTFRYVGGPRFPSCTPVTLFR